MRIGRLLIGSVPLIALVNACASAPHGVTPQPVFAPVADAASLRAVYDSAFSRLAGALPAPSDDEAVPLRQLRWLLQFRRDAVRWATLRGDAYVSLEPGLRGGGWLVIVPPGHPVLRQSIGFFELDPGPAHALQIRSAAVSEFWAGLLLVHGLSHLFDGVTGVLGRSPTYDQVLRGEVAIHRRMLAAADLLTRGAFRASLDGMLARTHPATISAVADSARHITDAEIGRLISAGLPVTDSVSGAELADRASFVRLALLIRYAEAHPVDDPALLHAFGSFVIPEERR